MEDTIVGAILKAVMWLGFGAIVVGLLFRFAAAIIRKIVGDPAAVYSMERTSPPKPKPAMGAARFLKYMGL